MPSAMILAAGLGTRLRPLTLELPKPLLWIGDEPALAQIARRLHKAGFTSAVMNTHHLAAAFQHDLLRRLCISLELVHEPEILGTSGAVANAIQHLGDGDILIWNGDILSELDANALLSSHAGDEGRAATLAVAPRPPGCGTVGLNHRGDIVRLRGECFGEEVKGGDFFGVHVLGKSLRNKLLTPGCLVGDVYLPALREGARLGSFLWDGGFLDIGTPRLYWEANMNWLSDKPNACHIEPSAGIAAGIAVEHAVIGKNAAVLGHGSLKDCVVWPGAQAIAPLERAIVTCEHGIVHI